MRGKRSKQYKKLMNQYGLTFGFREPYQVLLDAQIIQDTAQFKMDLVQSLERTLHGKVKPMVTQCSMRHLYTDAAHDQDLITRIKTFERRRCNHHTLDQPLSTIDCWKSVIDPKGSHTNKHRYVVASQDRDIRGWLRQIPGVPLIYVHRSVMILEPMAEITELQRTREEREKFKSGLNSRPKSASSSSLGKRKRTGEGQENEMPSTTLDFTESRQGVSGNEVELGQSKRKVKGPKEPNPLSMKKSKKSIQDPVKNSSLTSMSSGQEGDAHVETGLSTSQVPKKRKRKPSTRHEERSLGVET